MITNLKIGYNGRFGNQIFQFAALFGIANKNGYEVLIPKQNLTGVVQKTMDGNSFTGRFQLQDCFDIDERFFGDVYGLKYSITEPHFHFSENLFSIPDFSVLDGYFQSDKYFSHCKKELLKVLKFKQEIVDKSKYLLPTTDKELVSIHIRRGDYTHPNPYHPVISDEYIQNCINRFGESKYHFVVFSDDINWVKNKIDKEFWGKRDLFTAFESDSQFVDFCAMSLCDHHIISNSSFSWWSSYLCKNEDKIVYAPKRWFGPGFSNYITDDVYCDFMIKVGDEIETEKSSSEVDKKIINIFTICTGKYITLFENFYQTCEKYFLPNYKKKYYVFTDGDINNYENVNKIFQSKLGWPYDTMMRFKMFNSVEEQLDGEYVYFFNVNMSFVSEIGDEVIPEENNNFLMGVIHPGYENFNNSEYPYERKYESNFYIAYDSGTTYFQGCFNGGKKEDFMKMSKILDKKIDEDLSNGIIPVWHDESALNWYYSKINPLKMPSTYAYPESHGANAQSKIIQLDKNKLGGHHYLRN